MFKKIIVIGLVLLVLMGGLSYADETDTLENTVNELELTVKSLEEKNELVFTVVVWVFGITLTFVFFMIGGISYFNNKSNDKKIELIRAELNNEQLRKMDELHKEFDSHKKKLEVKFLEKTKEVEKNTKENVVKSIGFHTSGMRDDIKKLKIDYWLLELDTNKREFPSFTYLQIVEEASGFIEREYKIADILEKIEKILDEGNKLDSYDEENLNRLVNYIPDKFISQKERIVRKLKEL